MQCLKAMEVLSLLKQEVWIQAVQGLHNGSVRSSVFQTPIFLILSSLACGSCPQTCYLMDSEGYFNLQPHRKQGMQRTYQERSFQNPSVFILTTSQIELCPMATSSILAGHIATRQNCDSVSKKKKGEWIPGRKLVVFYSIQERNK